MLILRYVELVVSTYGQRRARSLDCAMYEATGCGLV